MATLSSSSSNCGADDASVRQRAFWIYCQHLADHVVHRNKQVAQANEPYLALYDETVEFKVFVAKNSSEEVLPLYQGHLLSYDMEDGDMVNFSLGKDVKPIPHELMFQDLRVMVSGRCVSGPLHPCCGNTMSLIRSGDDDEAQLEIAIHYGQNAILSGCLKGFAGTAEEVWSMYQDNRMPLYYLQMGTNDVRTGDPVDLECYGARFLEGCELILDTLHLRRHLIRPIHCLEEILPKSVPEIDLALSH